MTGWWSPAADPDEEWSDAADADAENANAIIGPPNPVAIHAQYLAIKHLIRHHTDCCMSSLRYTTRLSKHGYLVWFACRDLD